MAAAVEGSITAAAASHGTSQASASRRLDRLERDLGVQLLTRSPTGVELTDEGRRVVESGDALVAAAHELVRVAAQELPDTSKIPVAASLTVAEHLLPRWIGVFHSRSYHARVRPHIGNSEFVVNQLLTNRVHLGFVEDIAPHPEMASRTVAHDRMSMVVAPDHPWSRKDGPVPRSAITKSGLVVREVGSGTRAVVDAYLASFPDGVEVHEYRSNTAVKVAVRSGVAATITSELVVADELSTGNLIAVPFEGEPLMRPIRAVWPQTRHLAGPALEFLRVAESLGGADGMPDGGAGRGRD